MPLLLRHRHPPSPPRERMKWISGVGLKALYLFSRTYTLCRIATASTDFKPLVPLLSSFLYFYPPVKLLHPHADTHLYSFTFSLRFFFFFASLPISCHFSRSKPSISFLNLSLSFLIPLKIFPHFYLCRWGSCCYRFPFYITTYKQPLLTTHFTTFDFHHTNLYQEDFQSRKTFNIYCRKNLIDNSCFVLHDKICLWLQFLIEDIIVVN